MSNNYYDVNYGAIPPTHYTSDTITLDYTTQPSVVLNSTMDSGSGYIITTDNTSGAYNPFNGWKNIGIGAVTENETVHIGADGLTMKQGADIKIGGKSLCEAIEKIEERLGILKPNIELEERWDKLKELREQYMEMERDLLEKEKIMKILKET
jgi:hypothetical protein